MYIPRFITLSLLTTLAVFSAHGQSRQSSDIGFYGEVGYAPIDLKSDAGGTSTPKAARFILGKEINQNLAVEGMYMTTLSKDSRVGFEGTTSNYSIGLKPKMALTENTELFARVGWSHANITASAAGAHTGTDFIYGLGVQTNITKSVYGQLDYMSYFDKDGISAKGYSLSIGTRF